MGVDWSVASMMRRTSRDPTLLLHSIQVTSPGLVVVIWRNPRQKTWMFPILATQRNPLLVTPFIIVMMIQTSTWSYCEVRACTDCDFETDNSDAWLVCTHVFD